MRFALNSKHFNHLLVKLSIEYSAQLQLCFVYSQLHKMLENKNAFLHIKKGTTDLCMIVFLQDDAFHKSGTQRRYKGESTVHTLYALKRIL